MRFPTRTSSMSGAAHGLRHLSRVPALVSRTRSTKAAARGSISRARAIASACVGAMALARSAFGFRTA